MSVDRAELLRRPVRSLDDAKAWIRDLIAIDLLFHFEDDPAEIVASSRPADYTFAPDEVPLVRDRVAELYAIKWPAEIECPIGHALDLTEPGWRNR